MILDRLFRETSPGRDLPTWSFFTKLIVGKSSPQGPMLIRYRIAQSPYGGLYVHHLLCADADRDCHNHPWWFCTLVLRGGYKALVHDLSQSRLEVNEHRRGTLHFMWLYKFHKIISVKPDTWTLLFVSKKKQPWGFLVSDRMDSTGRFVPAHFVHWREYGAATSDPMDS